MYRKIDIYSSVDEISDLINAIKRYNTATRMYPHLNMNTYELYATNAEVLLEQYHIKICACTMKLNEEKERELEEVEKKGIAEFEIKINELFYWGLVLHIEMLPDTLEMTKAVDRIWNKVKRYITT